jgi:hypothetical protein
VTIEIPATRERFEAALVEDAQGVLCVVDAESARFVLSVILQGGWRIVDATPIERAHFKRTGSAAGRCSEQRTCHAGRCGRIA